MRARGGYGNVASMEATGIDEAALFVALAVVPGFASRNRHPELYASPVARRARMRARRIRSFVHAAREADDAAVVGPLGPGGTLTLTLLRHAPRSSWTLIGAALDAALCRYLLEKGGSSTAGQARLLAVLPPGGDDELARALTAMPRLLGLG